MKKLFVLAIMLTGLAGFSQGQSPAYKKISIITTQSSYKNTGTGTVYNLDKPRVSTAAEPSGNTAIYHGAEQPVYVSPRGKEFIYVTSKKTGNVYKKYIN